ncbi:MAG: hypothetical protein ANABAC_0915 [Anaerolineae bacterium]|nr:MAG: hypothetical protein ANABAC_0915 [Anaerolineae bacterium]
MVEGISLLPIAFTLAATGCFSKLSNNSINLEHVNSGLPKLLFCILTINLA